MFASRMPASARRARLSKGSARTTCDRLDAAKRPDGCAGGTADNEDTLHANQRAANYVSGYRANVGPQVCFHVIV